MALDISATDTEVQKPVNVIYQQLLLENARPLCPYFVGTEPGSIAMHAGSATAAWRRYDTSADNASGIAPSLTALSELTTTAGYGQGRSSDVVHFSAVTAAVSKYGQFFILNEEVDVFLPNGTMNGIVETLAITAGRVANQAQRNTAEDSLTQRFAGNVASAALVHAVITVGIIDRVLNELTTNSAMPFVAMPTQGSQNVGTVPILPALWGICHTHVAYDISKLSGFTSVEKYASQVDIMPGEFGFYGLAGVGCRFIWTPDATVDADAGAALSGADLRSTSGTVNDNYTTVIYGRQALGSLGLGQSWGDGIYRPGGDGNPSPIQLIVKGRGTARESGTGDPFDEVTTVASKLWHGSAVLNSNWGRAIVHAATNLSN